MGIKLVKLPTIEITNQGPSIKDVHKGGRGGQGERAHADMGGGGSSKGRRTLLVKNRSTVLLGDEKLLQGERLFDGEEKILS